MNVAASWSPPWLDGGDSAPVYHWRHGSVMERNLLEAEAAGRYGAGEIPAWSMHQAFADGIARLLPDDPDAGRLTEISQAEMRREPVEEADKALLDRARRTLAEHWPPYGALVEQQARRDAIIPTLAFRRFVTGWANVTDANGQPVVMARGPDQCLSDDVLALIEPWHVLVLGLNIYNSLYARGAEKNSAPPSKSGSAQKISNARRNSAAGGKSGRTSGRKTPR